MQSKFTAVRKEYQKLVLSVVSRFSSDLDVRKDLEAGVWEKLWDNSDRLEDKYGSTAGFIKKLAYNYCVDVYRAKKNNVKIDYLPEQSTKETPETVSEEMENIEYLKMILDKLPERERLVILMYYIECYPVKKIAIELQISQSLVKVILFRARGKIKNLLAGMDFFKDL